MKNVKLWSKPDEIKQSQAKQRQNCQKLLMSGVLKFRTGVLEIRDGTNLTVKSVS